MQSSIYGYAGQMLRVDLSNKHLTRESLQKSLLTEYVGGTGIGSRILYNEVRPGIEWNAPENVMILAAGPLGGTVVAGTGTFSVVTKGPMTNLAVASQANGFAGAFLKFSGFDGVIISGCADRLSYIYIDDGEAELRNAVHLSGKDTWETEDLIRKELGYSWGRMSVFSIGPAGENMVRFAAIVGDKGHVAGHNGVGAVLGAKKVKAIAVARGTAKVPVQDENRLREASSSLFEGAKAFDGASLSKWGTAAAVTRLYLTGVLPVKNYTTNLFPEYEKVDGRYIRSRFTYRPKPCWTCRMNHCGIMEVTEGPYKGVEGEEPEYECVASWSSQIGQSDAGSALMLTNLTDRLGLEVNESGWVVGWVMECYEKGILTKEDTDGLEMNWGNVESVKTILQKIARREGFGGVLADGVKRASERIGGEAASIAVYTLRGASPRTHDHRARWNEMLDTCVSGTSTIESGVVELPLEDLGLEKPEPFSPIDVSTITAKYNGWTTFIDSLGICRFCVRDQWQACLAAFNAVTGWGFTLDHAMNVGRRVVNLLRAFNIRHGLDPALEAPSQRYASTPLDGPARGRPITEHWQSMVRNYRTTMGWEPETGRPLPETLRRLGLQDVVADLWPSGG